MDMFNPADCYWAIGGDLTRVFSSKRNVMVPAADSEFERWLAAGNLGPRQIASEADLWQVLQQRLPNSLPSWMFDGSSFVQPAVGSFTKKQLTAYAADKRYSVEVGGLTVNAIPIATDRASQAMINGAYNLVQINPDISIDFKTDTGFVTLGASQITDLALAVANHVQKCFSAEATAASRVAAGTITAVADIDALFA